MEKIPLAEFVADKGQTEAGRLLGVTQGAIYKAVEKQRQIFVTAHEDGTYSAEELKPFPAISKTEAA